MAKGVILGVRPEEYERLTPAKVRELFSRLDKLREQEAKAEGDRHNAEFDALYKQVGNLTKAVNNTNELLGKLLKKPVI